MIGIYQGVSSCDIFFYVCFVSSCWGLVIIQRSVGSFVFFSYMEDKAMTEERDPQMMETELQCKDLMFYAKKTMLGFAALWEYFAPLS